ncbi:MAG: GldM family protein [Saprospiraceae bacterium]
MSIPKEPRQLMINIMYLVLTALLALNVSAEVFNAFKIVDKGLVKSNQAMEEANSKLPKAIIDGAKKKTSLAKYADLVSPIQSQSQQTFDFIQSIIDEIIDESGDRSGAVDAGDYVVVQGIEKLKGQKDFDATTRLLVDNGRGEELRTKLIDFRKAVINLGDNEDRSTLDKNIPNSIDDKTWKIKEATNSNYNWSLFNFGHMPVQAVLPILRKFQNDVKSTETEFLNYLSKKVGGVEDLVFDKFNIVSAPAKTYVINGEQFKTDIFLSASASGDSKTGINIKVNGRSLTVNSDGVASFTSKANGVGKKKYRVEASVTNPATGEVTSLSNNYEYEVGERSATISASKMNVFYIGVDNPVEVSVAGVPSSQVKVNMAGAGGGTIKRNGDGTYSVKVTRPTKKDEFAKVNLSAPGFSAGKDFRVKRIPDPIPKLSKSRGGVMSSGEFKAQGGVSAVLENFDFEARCKLSGYRVVRVPRRADPEIAENPGAKYRGETSRVINKAKPGDRFFFENIKCKCPGDPAARDLGTMSFSIK